MLPPALPRCCAALVLCGAAVLLASGCGRVDGASDAALLAYPSTRIDSGVVDVYHGERVADPYRWLEDDYSEETQDWVARQNRVTRAYLDALPDRDAIAERLETLYVFERYGTPVPAGEYLYFEHNTGLQDQSPLYREPIAGGARELVLDPNDLSADNTASVTARSFSADGQTMAYQVSYSGSDWKTVRFLDLATLTPLPDSLNYVKFSGLAWKDDGLFYSRYPPPDERTAHTAANEGHELRYHRLGTPQSEDALVFRDPAGGQRNVSASTTREERYLVRSQSEGTSGNAVAYADLDAGADVDALTFVPLVETYEDDYSLAGDAGGRLFFWTNADAPNGRLLEVQPARAPRFDEFLPEDPERPLSGASVADGVAYASYRDSVASRIERFDLYGNALGEVPLPGLGSASDVVARDGAPASYFQFSTFTQPGTVYAIDSAGGISVWASSDNGFPADDYVVKQVRYASKDGTEVPMFIVHKRGLSLDGERPTLLYGYGGFDIAIEPRHAVMRLDLFSPLLEQGGVAAVANIRGGGEFGREWHEAGTLARKQNVFDDFIAAAEYLQAEGYTSPERTAIYGRSNGGLLVGAVVTQRPDLVGVAFPAVGVHDMLRYHEFTIGWAWASDYGRSDSLDAYRYLKAYSPLHNARPADYPATLITTADHDDRVVPAHSFKFAAALQAAQRADAPVLLRVDTGSGHGSGKPVAKQIAEAADLLAFLFHNMDYAYAEPAAR